MCLELNFGLHTPVRDAFFLAKEMPPTVIVAISVRSAGCSSALQLRFETNYGPGVSGLRNARFGGEEISFWERWCFRGIAAALLIVVWGFSLDFVHRAMQWVGLRH